MPQVAINTTNYEVYASVATASLFLQADARLSPIWDGATLDGQSRALVTSTRLVNRQVWQGTVNPAGIGLLALSGNALDGETVTVDSKSYTFQTTLTDADGNVLIGADATTSLVNLALAINLSTGAGTAYAASTTVHPTVTAEAGPGALLEVVSKTAGATALAIPLAETLTNGSWGSTTLAQSSLVFPRSGLTDATGTALDSNSIPDGIINGAITLAALIVENAAVAEAANTGSNIEEVEAGPVSVTFFRPQTGTRFPQVVQELFGPFLGSAAAGLGGSVSFGTTSDATGDTTPKSNSFGQDFGLTEGLG